jgi:hypothetical protein
MGHISPSASLLDYEEIIRDLVGNKSNILYIYEWKVADFYAVRGFVQEREWLVIFGINGLMETAFPPEDMDAYLNKRGLVLIGSIKEVLQWT